MRFYILLFLILAFGTIDIPNTGLENTWQAVRLESIDLLAGANKVLRVSAAQGGFKLNNIKFFYNRTPFSVHSRPEKIEVEDYGFGGEGIAYNDTDTLNKGNKYRDDGFDINNANDIGGGYALGHVAKNEWLDYSIKDIKSGVYDVNFRISSKRSDANKIKA